MYDKGVFASPKSYAIENSEGLEIKIKGISNKGINFEDFKNKFYGDGMIEFNLQKINAKQTFKLRQKVISKNVWLSKYDKRKFSIDKKTTEPLEINTHIQ